MVRIERTIQCFPGDSLAKAIEFRRTTDLFSFRKVKKGPGKRIVKVPIRLILELIVEDIDG